MSDFDPSKLPFFESGKAFELTKDMGFYEYAVEMAADEVFLMSDTSEILYVNQSACQRLGYEESELVGKHVWEWDPLFPKEVWPGFFTEFTDKKYLHFETQHQTKTGEIFPVEIFAHLYIENDKNYLLAFVNDLTEKKKILQALDDQQKNLEDQVRKRTAELKTALEKAEIANEAKSQFLSTMSHELRTPLTSIKGTLSLLTNNVITDSEKIKEMQLVAYKNAERLARLVDDLLDFEKLRREGITYYDEDINIVELIHNAVKMEESYANKFNVTLKIDTSRCKKRTFYLDPHRIQQVIANFISNAIKYSPENDEVSITLISTSKKIRFSVKDNGRGIDDKFRNKIFDYFSQVDASDTRDKSGTGLGLAICKEIISHYNGIIDYESSPGNGTCFFFEIAASDSGND